jgi:hypothetical protein
MGNFRWLAFLLALLHLIPIAPSRAQSNLLSGNFRILPESKLFLTGSSNVSSFSCACYARNSQNNIKINLTDKLAVFQQARLQIQSGNLDCGNTIHSYNIRKFLDSENFPHIDIHLVYIQLKNDQSFFSTTGSGNLYSNVVLTIKNKSRLEEINFTGTKINAHRFHLVGTHTIRMRDYQMVPPTLFMGMIRIHEEIKLHFDLWVDWEDQ